MCVALLPEVLLQLVAELGQTAREGASVTAAQGRQALAHQRRNMAARRLHRRHDRLDKDGNQSTAGGGERNYTLQARLEKKQVKNELDRRY